MRPDDLRFRDLPAYVGGRGEESAGGLILFARNLGAARISAASLAIGVEAT